METVTISKVKYDQLIRDQEILHALYDGGVDNWEGYSESLREILDEDEEEDESWLAEQLHMISAGVN